MLKIQSSVRGWLTRKGLSPSQQRQEEHELFMRQTFFAVEDLVSETVGQDLVFELLLEILAHRPGTDEPDPFSPYSQLEQRAFVTWHEVSSGVVDEITEECVRESLREMSNQFLHTATLNAKVQYSYR